MNFTERLKILGCKEFWKGYFEGIGIGWRKSMELLKKNKLYIFLVIGNVIFAIPMTIISMFLIVFCPKALNVLCEAVDEFWKDVGIK